MSYLIETQYFPCVDYFKLLINDKDIIIEQFESYQKMSFRNRCVIYGANGLINLTVPLVGGREQKQVIREVEIDYTLDWPKIHWRGIKSAYSKSPFYEFYASDIENLIFSKEKYMFDLNIKIVDRISKLLKINSLINFSERYDRQTGNEIEDFRNKILPNNFQKEGDSWRPKYFQQFSERNGFQPNLSILDLLFAEGPNTINILF